MLIRPNINTLFLVLPVNINYAYDKKRDFLLDKAKSDLFKISNN